jgi:uncharacterized protein (TIGR03000 family)
MLRTSRALWIALAVIGSSLPALAQEGDSQPGTLVVHLPSHAQLFIAGQPTRQVGATRRFESPPLRGGRTFTYQLQARWVENGREVVVDKEVDMFAGREAVVHFVPPAAGNGAKMPAPENAKSREFFFTYTATVKGLPPDKTARIWLPVPSTSEDQKVTVVSQDPAGQIGTEPKYGNRIYYYEGTAGADGTIKVQLKFRVKRFEVKGDQNQTAAADEQTQTFLAPDAMVPVGGKALTLVQGKTLPTEALALARVFYDAVNDHMRYSKEGTGWGRGDVEWACDSKYGNCTDFHSLFISLSRAHKIPAKFEIGFSIPEKRGAGPVPGYHCWAKFKPQGRGWIPVDISEANKVKAKDNQMVNYYFGNLTEDRVTFSTGRDLRLEPVQQGKPLNFFIYPYVEVDGKQYDNVERQFAYEDVAEKK